MHEWIEKKKWVLFMSFFVLGVCIFLFAKTYWLSEGSVLSKNELLYLTGCTWNNRDYLMYLIFNRMPFYLVLLWISRFRCVKALVYFMELGYVCSLGMIVAECVTRFGWKGLLLVFAIGFPQLICYYAGLELLIVCQKRIESGIKQRNVIILCRYGFSILIYIIGIVLEAYWNWKIVLKTIFLL